MKKKLTNKLKRVIFLLPALNEEKAISSTIDKIPKDILEEKGYSCEIAIVDGGSRDKTVEISKSKNVSVIQSPRKGYGFQYKYALSRLEGDIVITGDADATYPLNMAPKLLEILEKENLDFITTNRFACLERNSMSISHYFGNKILTFAGNLLFNLRLNDNQSGMWCFKLDKIRNLGLENNDMAFSEEIKIRAFKKLRCREVSIRYAPRIGKSKLNYSHAFKNFFFLFKLRLRI